MMFKITGGVPAPITDQQFRAYVAPAALPRGYQKDATFLESYGIVSPARNPKPDHDAATQMVTPDSLPTLKGDVWTLGWTVVDRSSVDITQERLTQASAECHSRIFAVADLTAQMNMASLASAGGMTEDQLAAYRAGLGWIEQMRATWRILAADISKDISDDVNWPTCPTEAIALSGGF